MGKHQLKTFVVTTKDNHKRQESINCQAKKFQLDIEYIWDFDADDIDVKKIEEKYESSLLPLRSISALMKHFEAHRRLLEQELDIALVVEDDVILFENFGKRIHKLVQALKDTNRPGLVFLGGADNRIDHNFLAAAAHGEPLIKKPLSTAEAYLIEPLGASKRLKWLEEAHRIKLPADHLLTAIDLELGIDQYWGESPLATQGSIIGKFPTTLDKSRGKHSACYLRARYIWNRFRRQQLPRTLFNLNKLLLAISPKRY